MSTTEKSTTEAEKPRIETAIARDVTTSLDPSTGAATTTIEEFNGEDLEGLDEEDTGETQEASEEEGGEQPEEGDEGDKTPEDLPPYDPENEEVRSKYDERYFTEGKLNQTALSTEWWASFAKNGNDPEKAGLSEDTYKYLEDTLGLTKDGIKQVEKGQYALRVQEQADWLNKIGGPGIYTAATAWAQKGGYNEEQRKRFKAAFDKGGEERDEAVELLISRYKGQRNGRGQQDGGRRGPPGRRPSSPRKDVTGQTASGGRSGDVYATREEHTAVQREAQERLQAAKASDDKKGVRQAYKELDAIRAKARRSFVRA